MTKVKLEFMKPEYGEEYFESEEFYANDRWYEEDLPEDHPWFGISGELGFAKAQLNKVTIAQNASQRKKLAENSKGYVLDKSRKNDRRSISALNQANVLLSLVEDKIQNRDISLHFLNDWGELMENIGIIRQRLNLQSNKRATAGAASKKNTSKKEQLYWIALWLKTNTDISRNNLVVEELNKLVVLVCDIANEKIVLSNLPRTDSTWFGQMLKYNRKTNKYEKVFYSTFSRLRHDAINRVLADNNIAPEQVPSTSKS